MLYISVFDMSECIKVNAVTVLYDMYKLSSPISTLGLWIADEIN